MIASYGDNLLSQEIRRRKRFSAVSKHRYRTWRTRFGSTGSCGASGAINRDPAPDAFENCVANAAVDFVLVDGGRQDAVGLGLGHLDAPQLQQGQWLTKWFCEGSAAKGESKHQPVVFAARSVPHLELLLDLKENRSCRAHPIADLGAYGELARPAVFNHPAGLSIVLDLHRVKAADSEIPSPVGRDPITDAISHPCLRAIAVLRVAIVPCEFVAPGQREIPARRRRPGQVAVERATETVQRGIDR